MKLLFLCLTFSAVLLNAQVPSLQQRDSLPPGSKMPSVSAEWINEPVRKAPAEKQKQITVLTLVDILSPDIFQTLRMIESLEKKGYIRRDPTKPRAIEILDGTPDEFENYQSDQEIIDVPVIGTITAGTPILAVENIEDTFPLPASYAAGGKNN